MAYTTFILPFRPVFDSNGLPVPGAKLNFYLTGTLVRSPVYADSALTTQLPNPVVANSAGRFVDIFLDAAVIYRVTITDENDVLLDDSDPYAFGNAGVSVDLISTQTISGAKTFSSGLTTADQVYGAAWDANLTVPTKNAVYDKIQSMPAGTVTSVSVATAAGVSGTVATATTTPAITVTLGAITPTSISTGAITASGAITAVDEVYGAAWNGSLQVPTKNAVYDKIEAAALADKWTLLSTTTISGVTASVTQTGLTGYNDILVVLDGVSHNDAGAGQFFAHYSTDGTTFPVSNLITGGVNAANTMDAVAFITSAAGYVLSVSSYDTSNIGVTIRQELGATLSAVKVQPLAGSFDAGVIKFYAR